jgi:F0F1-type ATP synthase delta subunit
MKKLDLHIHTIETMSDSPFSFSIEKLRDYIQALRIDGIALTNHNTFDLTQYKEIQSSLSDICVVLPGIEINLGKSNFGHIICITDQDDIEDFYIRCKVVQGKIVTSKDFISLDELQQIFPDLEKYLWIPHYDKKPIVDSDILSAMGTCILCGEVGSVKKFIYRQKDLESLIPVYFSDLRPSEDLEVFPSRQTYFDIDEISVSSIKKSLIDKRHVSLTENEGNRLFYALPDLPVSTGLTVVIGERSSGKSFTLDQIAKQYDNVKYIKQFDLIETKPEQAAKDFTDQIAAKRSSFAEDYFAPFKEAVDIVKNISLDRDEQDLAQFVSSLIRFAKDSDRADVFAKCALYNESKFPTRSFDNIKKLIESVKNLLDAHEYRDVIEKHVTRDELIALLKELIYRYRQEKRRSLEETWVNDLVGEVKRSLSFRTSAEVVPDFDFYECQMNRIKVRMFNDLVNLIKIETVINRKMVGGFVIQTRKRPYFTANELKYFSGKKNVSFSKYMNEYVNNPYRYLLALMGMEGIPETDYYKYFVFVDYQILNQYGFSVSGGERAEFKLLQEIDDANRFDILLIDEPESSFDNLFLRDRVNQIIRELSENMPVILVTHNNTVGASIRPDYLIYTRRIIGNDITYERYYGLPSSKELISSSGNSIKNFQVVLDCLEAGENTYNERKRDYDLLKD